MLKQVRIFIIFILVIITLLATVFMVTGYVIFNVLELVPENGWWIDPRVTQLIGFALAAFVITLFLFAYVTVKYFKPIDALAEAMDKVAEGDFTQQLPVSGSGDEIDKMNLNFNKMVNELRSNETLQSDFVQNVSHEFKTPLASIKGYAVLLDDMADRMENSAQAKEYTGRIIKSASSLSTLAGNILSLSKLENQHIVSEKTEFMLDEQIRQAYLSLEPIWSKRDISIDMELPEMKYVGNESILFQVWTNLFSNAIKFTPDGGTITASVGTGHHEANAFSFSAAGTAEDSQSAASEDDFDCGLKTEQKQDAVGDIYVTITDTGIGMTEEEMKHIFDRFYQAETNRSRAGNGLGLTLVKKIVELSGGSIYVKSVPGKGSAFTVALPAVKLL